MNQTNNRKKTGIRRFFFAFYRKYWGKYFEATTIRLDLYIISAFSNIHLKLDWVISPALPNACKGYFF
jgi:hypothetical protein